MRKSDWIELVEAAYAMDAPHEVWQRRLTELAADQWDGEAGSLVYDLASDPNRALRTSHLWCGSEEKREAFMIVAALEYPVELARKMLGGPHLTSLYELAAALGVELGSYELLEQIRRRAPRFHPDWFSHGVIAIDPSARGVQLAFSARPITPHMREVWARVGSHVAIAYRLRRKLAALAEASVEPAGEAVIELDGRCVHAEGAARSERAREILRLAARAVMRARGSLRAREPDEALEIWRGLADGRWSLVDRFDSDGRHYLVAHENPPEVRDHRALSPREAQVAAYLAFGLSDKVIGYALGVEPTTVHDHVTSIRRKLGVGSRTELVRLLSALETAAAGGRDAPAQAES